MKTSRMNLDKYRYLVSLVKYDRRSDTCISLAGNFEYIFTVTLQDNILHLNKNLKYTFKNYAAEKMTYMKLVFIIYRRYAAKITSMVLWLCWCVQKA